MRPQDKLRAANGHLLNAKRKLNEAITLGMALANGEEPEEPETPRPVMPFRPTSPNRDAARFHAEPPNSLYMKPSRLAKRGRHGSRRRR